MAEVTSRADALPRGRLRFTGLAFALGVLILGTNLPSPLYAVYGHRFGFSPLTITMLVSVYVAVLVPALLMCGSLADSAGLRRVVVPAILAAALGAVLFAAADGTGWLFAARSVQGLAVGAASGPLTAALVATEPAGNQARASLLASLMTTCGAGLGPVLAGGLAQYAPAPLVSCYLLELGLLAVALGVVATLRGGGRGRARMRLPRIPAEIRTPFAVAGAVSFLAWAVAYIVLGLVPSYVEGAVHSGNLLLGGGAAGMLLLCAAVAQVAFARWAPERTMPAGLVLLVLGLVGLVAAGLLSSVPLLLSTVAVTGIGQGLAFMGALRRVNDLAPPSERAGVASAFYVVTYLGGGGPVIVVGLLAIPLGLVPAVQLAAGVLALACLAALVAVRRSA
jgi:MFS family permease